MAAASELERWETDGGTVRRPAWTRSEPTMTTLERSTPGAERSLDRPVMTFDLPAIIADLKQEPTWRTARRNAITLLKQPRFRIVLVVLQGRGRGRFSSDGQPRHHTGSG